MNNKVDLAIYIAKSKHICYTKGGSISSVSHSPTSAQKTGANDSFFSLIINGTLKPKENSSQKFKPN